MHSKIILYLSIFLIEFPLSGMNQTAKDYLVIEQKIMNPQLYLSADQIERGYSVAAYNNGKYMVSNCAPDSTKIFFCFSGNFKKNDREIKKETDILAQNPLSLLDINTGINKPFRPVPELDNKTPVSAIHMLDEKTCTVAHDKNIYLLQEKWDPRNILNIFKFHMHEYTLKKIQILSPQLSKNKNDADTIIMIDNIDSLLIAISKKGFITTWGKNGSKISNSIHQNMQCTEPFFSCALNHKENLLCLGLHNGKIFIADVKDLKNNKIVSIFPGSYTKINLLSSYDNSVFAGQLYEGPHPKREYCEKSHCKEDYCNNHDKKIDCCLKYYVTTTCKQCKKNNYNNVYSDGMISVRKKNLLNKHHILMLQLKKLNAQNCVHTRKAKKNLPSLCHYHQHMENPCKIQNALINAQELINQLNVTTEHMDKITFKFSTLKSNIHNCIEKINLLPNNKLLVCVHEHCSEEYYLDDRHQAFLIDIQNSNNTFEMIYNKPSYTIHPIATNNNSFVLLKETKKRMLHITLKTLTKYTKNSWNDWYKNKYYKIIPLIYYKVHRIFLILVYSILRILIPLSLFYAFLICQSN